MPEHEPIGVEPTEIDLPDGTIRHRVVGPDDGHPVVFVHGALVDSRLWDQVARRLVAAGMRCHLPDWPLGSHRLPMPEEADVSPNGQADRIAGYLEHLGLDGVTLVVNDSGGAITQLLLTRDRSRIGRVVFTNCDTFERFPPPPFDLMFHLARHPLLTRVLVAPARWAPLRRAMGYGLLMTGRSHDELTADWLRPLWNEPKIARDMARFCRGIDETDLTGNAERLGAVELPVRFVWASQDRYFRLADGRRLAACFPDGHARVVEVEDSKTFVPLDRPDALADEVIQLVGETECSSTR